MYNLRYHIVTIVSVFSALALGLVLGGLIVGKTPTSPTGLVADLKTEFATLRSDNKSLTADVSAYDEFSTMLVADGVSGILNGKTQVILGLDTRAVTLAKANLESAGAKVITVTVKSDALDMTATKSPAADAITRIMQEHSFSDPYDAIGLGLVEEWAKGWTGPKVFTEALVAQGILTIKGESATAATENDVAQPIGGIDGIVNVAAVSGKPDDLCLAIMRQFSKKAVPAASASLFHGSTDPAVKSWEQGVSATTMLGSPIGTYALVALMNGAEPGLYGVGAGTKALAPKMPSKREAPAGAPSDGATEAKP